MGLDSKWRLNVVNLKKPVTKATFEAVRDTFEIDIKAEAKKLSPVSEEWPSIPASRGEKRIDTGHNRRSIDTEVKEVPNGVTAELFTQSGYGGHLEIGTSRMPARPYLYPAFNRHRKTLAKALRTKIAALKRLKRNG